MALQEMAQLKNPEALSSRRGASGLLGGQISASNPNASEVNLVCGAAGVEKSHFKKSSAATCLSGNNVPIALDNPQISPGSFH